MRETIAIAGGVIIFASIIPYLIDTVKGRTHPNLVSWFTWTLLTGIATVATLSAGHFEAGMLTLGATLATASVVVLGFKNGVKRYTKFDIFCQAVALLAIALWQTTQDPAAAVVLTVAADVMGALPTLRHAWQSPQAETASTFLIGSLGSLLALISLEEFNLISLPYPIYLTLSNLTIGLVIVYRRKVRAREA